MTYQNIDAYLNGALVVAAASVVLISALAYAVRRNRWCIAACGLLLLFGLFLATPALSTLLSVAASADGITDVHKAALAAKINGHLIVLSVILGAVGANLLTTAITHDRSA